VTANIAIKFDIDLRPLGTVSYIWGTSTPYLNTAQPTILQ